MSFLKKLFGGLLLSSCAYRPLDVPEPSADQSSAADAALVSLADAGTPFASALTITTAAVGGCTGWTVNISDRDSNECLGISTTGLNVFLANAATPAVYSTVPTILDACATQKVWATYSNSERPTIGTVTVTMLKQEANGDATIDGSYDLTVSDGGGEHFTGIFHAPPCAF